MNLDKRVSDFLNAMRQAGLGTKGYVVYNIYKGAKDIISKQFRYILLDGNYKDVFINGDTSDFTIKQCVDILQDFYNTEQVTEQALKFDDNKTDWELFDFSLFEPIVRVLMFGEKKYGRNNWRKGHYTIKVFNALLRHLFAYIKGEDLDKESGLSHLGHAGACLMFLFYNTNTKFDNRSKNEQI